MSNIPGLNFRPDDEIGEGIEIPTLNGVMTVPDSHRFGNCRTVYDFDKLGLIFSGQFGKIYKCKNKRSNELVGLKKWDITSGLDDGISSSILREISLLKAIKHDNIISSYGMVAGKNLDSNYLMLDYCPISLEDLIEQKVETICEPTVVKLIMKQLFQGLAYIHEALIIHRNINPENIVFTPGGILKITGFHSSRYFYKGNMTPDVTKLEYRAPELLFQTKKYNTPIDVWSAGCVFALLLLKKPLIAGSSELEVLHCIMNVLGAPNEGIWPGFNDLFSPWSKKYVNATDFVENGCPYNQLKKCLPEAASESTSYDLLKDILLYYPDARNSAKDCAISSYVTAHPDACSLEEMCSILREMILDSDEAVRMEI